MTSEALQTIGILATVITQAVALTWFLFRIHEEVRHVVRVQAESKEVLRQICDEVVASSRQGEREHRKLMAMAGDIQNQCIDLKNQNMNMILNSLKDALRDARA